jgi:hypothetical protein
MTYEFSANQFLAQEGVKNTVQDAEQGWLSQNPVNFDLLADQFLARERVQNALQEAEKARLYQKPKFPKVSEPQRSSERPRLKEYLALLLHPQW